MEATISELGKESSIWEGEKSGSTQKTGPASPNFGETAGLSIRWITCNHFSFASSGPPVPFKEQDFPSKHNHVVVCLSTALLCRE